MNPLFVDTQYWVALLNPRDQWHKRALELESAVAGRELVSTETVLIELLNYLSGYGPLLRRRVIDVVRRILEHDEMEAILHTHDAFLSALALYESRLDKGYSLTDCISMNTMRERGIAEVLGHDRHFTQEGFSILM